MLHHLPVYNDVMDGDTPHGLRHELMLWQEALRRIADNPVAHYLALAEKRRLGRVPRWRTFAGYGTIIALWLFAIIALTLEETGLLSWGYEPVLCLMVSAGILAVLLGLGTLLYLTAARPLGWLDPKTIRRMALWLGLLPLGIAVVLLLPIFVPFEGYESYQINLHDYGLWTLLGFALGIVGLFFLVHFAAQSIGKSKVQGTRSRRVLWFVILPLGAALALIWPWLLSPEVRQYLLDQTGMEELLIPAGYITLSTLSLIYIAFSMGRIFAVVGDALRVLALNPQRQWQLAIDDLLAVTPIDDRDVALGLLKITVPRLWPVSIAGAILYWLWLWITTQNLFYGASHWSTMFLLLAPITIACIAFSGFLGGLVLVLWLIAHGRGSSGRYTAPITGAVVAIGHGVHIIASVGVLFFFIGMTSGYGSNNGMGLSLLTLLPIAFAVVAVGYYLLLPSGRWQQSTAYRAYLAPMAYPIVMALVPLTTYFLLVFSIDEELMGSIMMAYHMGWTGTTLISPLALPSLLCLGTEFEDWAGAVVFIEYNYILLIIQQMVMVVIGLHHVRLAVMRRRQAI